MERDDLDRFLSSDEIVLSSGFVDRVMDAVRHEAEAPPAIPFPWSRALPGIIAVTVALVSAIAGLLSSGPSSIEGDAPSTLIWALVVLLLSAVPVVWSLRITRGHS